MAIQYGYSAGTIRNQPISAELERVLNLAAEAAGVDDVVVFSGGQPAEGDNRTGSHRHDDGGAADIRLVVGGRELDMTNPADQAIMARFVTTARANGAGGIGGAEGYMGPNALHVGFGTPAVWGAGGRSANAPEWLVAAYNAGAEGAPIPPLEVGQTMRQGYQAFLGAGQQPGAVATAANYLPYNPDLLGSDTLRAGIGVGQQGGDPRVETLQRFLNSQGANLDIDGDFGPATEAAVRAFQQQAGITVDGIVGPETYQAIKQASSQGQGTPPMPRERPNIMQTLDAYRRARSEGRSAWQAFQGAIGARRSTPQTTGPATGPKPMQPGVNKDGYGSAPVPRANPQRVPTFEPYGGLNIYLADNPPLIGQSGGAQPYGGLQSYLRDNPPQQAPLDPASLYTMSLPELQDIVRNRDMTPEELRMVSEVIDLRSQREAATAYQANQNIPLLSQGEMAARTPYVQEMAARGRERRAAQRDRNQQAPADAMPPLIRDPSQPFATGQVTGPTMPVYPDPQEALRYAMTGRPTVPVQRRAAAPPAVRANPSRYRGATT